MENKNMPELLESYKETNKTTTIEQLSFYAYCVTIFTTVILFILFIVGKQQESQLSMVQTDHTLYLNNSLILYGGYGMLGISSLSLMLYLIFLLPKRKATKQLITQIQERMIQSLLESPTSTLHDAGTYTIHFKTPVRYDRVARGCISFQDKYVCEQKIFISNTDKLPKGTLIAVTAYQKSKQATLDGLDLTPQEKKGISSKLQEVDYIYNIEIKNHYS